MPSVCADAPNSGATQQEARIMTEGRIQRAASADGTEIVGRVSGHGSPLVLVHGAIGDGEFAWDELLPHLTDRFTCYLPSTRGRGLSGDHPDHSLPRLQEDVIAFVESIGEPVSLMGWSGGGPFVLGAAARSDAVAAVAVWESGASADALGPDGQACLGQLAAAIEQVGVAASDGRLIDAVHAFLAGICNDDEVAALDGTDFHERWSGGVPQLLSFFQHLMAFEGPGPDHPEALAQVTVPVLLLTGEETLLGAAFDDAVQHIARHVADPHVREVPGVGHFAPVVAPESVARDLTAYFEAALQPA
jgi:pimeloyl-ACP methyl ester carboxylesterase